MGLVQPILRLETAMMHAKIKEAIVTPSIDVEWE
jgi:hypothetical protein